jgi:hypothetical protein
MNRFVDGCSASGANEEVAGVGMSALPEFDDAPVASRGQSMSTLPRPEACPFVALNWSADHASGSSGCEVTRKGEAEIVRFPDGLCLEQRRFSVRIPGMAEPSDK